MTDDETQALVDALRRKVNAQAGRIDELEEQMDTLMKTVEPDPERSSYDQLTRENKVHKIRTTLLRQALDTNGTAAMKYKEVKALFDGHPSDGHAYDLMRYAGEMDGFEYQTDPASRVVVNATDVNDTALIHTVKNADTANPA